MRARPTILVATAFLFIGCGSGGDRLNNAIEGPAHSTETLTSRTAATSTATAALADAAGQERDLAPKQILFGDLHVHTTYSPDAFTLALPVMGGQGAHTLSDACDFARYCSSLDFFSHNDHAEALIPEHWEETRKAVRACNARANDPANQDLMVFAGWEWTQVGLTPETHWGHKNVIFLGQEDDELPARAINSRPYGADIGLFMSVRQAGLARYVDPGNWGQYKDLEWMIDRIIDVPECPRDVDSRELPADCHENAPTPKDLYRKLDEWGFDSLVIPHGTAWGSYTPPLTSWDKTLTNEMHDPEKVRLVEIMSGHGNSEEYRSFRNFSEGEDGTLSCPAPTAGFLPCCWRAGEIQRDRCGDIPEAECAALVVDAQQKAMRASVTPSFIFPDTTPEDWLDCDQCRDCFKPSFNYRPTESVQYAMALSSSEETDENGDPLRFRWGFIGSTDDHTSRPGTGYKQYARKKMTFAPGMQNDFMSPRESLPMDDPNRAMALPPDIRNMDAERVTSFTYPGGIVAVHAPSRTREDVWGALKGREVYGTSGPKILLWFDLLNGPDGPVPMGGAAKMTSTPRFEVRAAGAFIQKPGCPGTSVAGLSPERLEALCAGECDHPSDVRHAITAIEVVRIRPRTDPSERPEDLIEDPWKRVACTPSADGCTAVFEDTDFADSGRDVLYYARAIQEATPAINGDLLRTTFDTEGNALSVEPCYGDYRTSMDDDCLAPANERAWSSPIYIDFLVPGPEGENPPS